jgi:large subunit ribosomal protein L29
MKAHQLRELSVAEIQSRLDDEIKDLNKLRFNKAIAGSGENPAKLRVHRRSIARLKTILLEKSGDELVNNVTE